MNLTDPAGAGGPRPPPSPPPALDLQLRVEDALASGRRLWVRGQVLGLDAAGKPEPASRWWGRWWGKPDGREAPPPVTLETQVSGCTLQAPVPLDPDGH